jgi:hypothetical protein
MTWTPFQLPSTSLSNVALPALSTEPLSLLSIHTTYSILICPLSERNHSPPQSLSILTKLLLFPPLRVVLLIPFP